MLAATPGVHVILILDKDICVIVKSVGARGTVAHTDTVTVTSGSAATTQVTQAANNKTASRTANNPLL